MKLIRSDREERLEELDRVFHEISRLASQIQPEEGILELNIVDRQTITRLNERYKKRKGPAEILTFSYLDERLNYQAEDSPLAEIYLCWSQIVEGARRRGVQPEIYLLRLFVHGICHLMNYSHRDEKSAELMEEAEKEMLGDHLSRDEISKLFC